MAKLVAATYGDALFDLAVEGGCLDEMQEEVSVVSAALQENPKLAELMTHPKIAKEEKIRIVEEIFGGRVSAELVGLLRLIVEKDHFGEVMSVFDYFTGRVKAYKKIGIVYVTSALPLRKEQKQAVEQRILKTTDFAELEMHYAEDSSLLGGMVIRIGDRVADSSVRTKLADLTRQLSQASLFSA